MQWVFLPPFKTAPAPFPTLPTKRTDKSVAHPLLIHYSTIFKSHLINGLGGQKPSHIISVLIFSSEVILQEFSHVQNILPIHLLAVSNPWTTSGTSFTLPGLRAGKHAQHPLQRASQMLFTMRGDLPSAAGFCWTGVH